jgi:hypothetical protein
MHSESVITFNGYTPMMETLVSKVKEMTGLDITVKTLAKGVAKFRHVEFDPLESTVSIGDSEVRVFTMQIEISYLFEAIMAAAVSLGGETADEINPLAFQKWRDVKDKFENVKFMDWPYNEE